MSAKHRTTRIGKAGVGLAALTVVATLTGCWGNRSEKPPVHIIWNMDFQDKWDPQEPAEFFADKRASRPEVPGTVARGHLKDDDLLWRGQDFDGKFADRLPEGMSLSTELLSRGEERYNIYCSPCHDTTGRGQGPATLRGGGFKVPPANLHEKARRALALGQIYDVITNGKMPNMLPYAAQIPVEDRWAIAAWVRVLQVHGQDKGWGQPKMATADASAAGAAAPAANKEGSR